MANQRKRVTRERSRMGKRLTTQKEWDIFMTQVASLSRVHSVPMAVCRGADGEAVLVVGAAGLEGLTVMAGVDMRERGARLTATWQLRRDGWVRFAGMAEPVPAGRGRGRPPVTVRASVFDDVVYPAPGEDAEVVS